MVDQKYVKQLEDRVEFYEKLFSDLKGGQIEGFDSVEEHKSELFFETLCGIQPFSFEDYRLRGYVLGYALRIQNSPTVPQQKIQAASLNMETSKCDFSHCHVYPKLTIINSILSRSKVDCLSLLRCSDDPERIRTLYTCLLKASNNIASKTKRGAASIVWCSSKVFELISLSDKFNQHKDDHGTMGRFFVYEDKHLPFEGALVSYKGTYENDAGVIVSPVGNKKIIHFIGGWENYYGSLLITL